MQNNVIRNYKIGDLCFRYIGPDFTEVEYLKIFRIDVLKNDKPDIIYEMIRQERLEIPGEMCLKQDEYVDVYEKDGKRIRVIYDSKREHAIIKDSWSKDGYHKVEYDVAHMSFWNTNMMMKIFDIPNQVILRGGIFLHASCIECNDHGILFTAAKQTGKSTQAALWERYRKAEIINGDRTLLRKTESSWRAYGSPYAGTSRVFKNKDVKIDVIVVLSQGIENKVYEMTSFDALRALMEGCSYEKWDRNSVIQVMDIIQDLLKNVKFVKLECKPDITAVEALEEYLWELKTEK